MRTWNHCPGKRVVLISKIRQEHWQHLLGIASQGILSSGDAPVIHEGSFADCISFYDLSHRDIAAQLSCILAFQNDFAQQSVVQTTPIQQRLFAPGNQLGRQKSCQQIYGNAVLDHGEQFLIQK